MDTNGVANLEVQEFSLLLFFFIVFVSIQTHEMYFV